MKKLALSALLMSSTIAVFAGDLAAGKNAEAKAKAFEQIDENRDGFITQQEAVKLPELKSKFAELDKDKNAKLDKREYLAFVDDKK